ncbi:hypothetical protein Afil01_35050 [Actinorhabdospora filicis]|uniref:RDD domain-containing protein n=1 Tax=Actinorhabdospora filicis TaxID=1785913 RepID=A0A9W6WA62_9ACTN|nr:RDD family protein [Actinorhabdospora filicis]GLZ78698.1 hypothetical protein Afil01_35050 [Actinorhabdospora filicis]
MSMPAGGFAVPMRAPAPMPVTLASPWERLAAHLLDNLIVGGLTSVITIPLWLMNTADRARHQQDVQQRILSGEHADLSDAFYGRYYLGLALISAIVMLAQVAYQILMTTRWEATVGKRVLRLRIVRAEDWRPPTGGRMLARAGVAGLFGIINCVALADVLSIFGARRQTLHDICGRTSVIKLPPPLPPGYTPYR